MEEMNNEAPQPFFREIPPHKRQRRKPHGDLDWHELDFGPRTQLLHGLWDLWTNDEIAMLERTLEEEQETIWENFPVWLNALRSQLRTTEAMDDFVQLFLYVARSYRKRGDERFFSHLDPMDHPNPITDSDTKLRQAISNIESGDLEAAESLLLDVIGLNSAMVGTGPEFYLPRAYGYLAIVHYRRRTWETAEDYASRALRLCLEQRDDGGVLAYANTLIQIKYASGDYRRAGRYLRHYLGANLRMKQFRPFLKGVIKGGPLLVKSCGSWLSGSKT